ncbi:MAG: ABC transporter permease [Halanaerobiales bacterium]
MIDFIINNWQRALVLTAEHLYIVFIATTIAIAIAVPLGIFLTVKEKYAEIVLNLANIVMTIPSIALFGLMLPVLSVFGVGLGIVPVIIALILYDQLPIIRNTYTAIRDIDQSIIDAARGMGLSEYRILKEIKIPIVMPVIIAGIRVAAVMNIGIVTIAVYVGAGGLGKFIQRGIDQVYDEQIMAGAILVALLAVVIEGILYLLEYILTPPHLRGAENE